MSNDSAAAHTKHAPKDAGEAKEQKLDRPNSNIDVPNLLESGHNNLMNARLESRNTLPTTFPSADNLLAHNQQGKPTDQTSAPKPFDNNPSHYKDYSEYIAAYGKNSDTVNITSTSNMLDHGHRGPFSQQMERSSQFMLPGASMLLGPSSVSAETSIKQTLERGMTAEELRAFRAEDEKGPRHKALETKVDNIKDNISRSIVDRLSTPERERLERDLTSYHDQWTVKDRNTSLLPPYLSDPRMPESVRNYYAAIKEETQRRYPPTPAKITPMWN